MNSPFDDGFLDGQSELRQKLFKAALMLTKLTYTSEIRDYVLQFLSTFSNVERAAVLVDYSLWEMNRGDSEARSATAIPAVDQVMKDGEGVIAMDATPSVIAVPMETPKTRIGVLYIESTDPGTPLTPTDAMVLVAMGPILAAKFEGGLHLERIEGENERLRAEADQQSELIGETPVMAKHREQIAKVAPSTSTVLIRGESGTGKEFVARTIHRLSKRPGSFVSLNCAAIQETLVESELFGHEKGSFTGALTQKKGLFEAADKGTLFLDEIGEISPAVQAKLLRAIELKEIQRVGSTRPIPVDVRIVAATHVNLEEAVAAKKFRSDLYYRLKVVQIDTPPLRSRGPDILLLARHFLKRYRNDANRVIHGFAAEAETILLSHGWPGNVRELQNVVRNAIVMGSSNLIVPEDLAIDPAGAEAGALMPYNDAMYRFMRTILQEALDRYQGDVKRAAAALRLPLSTMYRHLETVGLRQSGSANA